MIKVIMLDLQNCFFDECLSTVPWCFLLSFITFSFCLQITYTKVRNLQIGIDNLVLKVSINLLHHKKSATCIITIIINPSTFLYIHS